jgi:hypothetical protein
MQGSSAGCYSTVKDQKNLKLLPKNMRCVDEALVAFIIRLNLSTDGRNIERGIGVYWL